VDDASLLSLIDKVKTASAFFVAVGVVGEFLGGFVADPIIRRRDEAQRAEIARLNKEAGQARESAGDAMERAAKLEKEAEQERLARVRIEERLAPRRITAAQHRVIAGLLQKFKGETIMLLPSSTDGEVADFVQDIELAFKDSGFTVGGARLAFGTPSTHGLEMAVGKSKLPVANEIAKAFLTAGVVQQPIRITSDDNPSLRMFIGSK
jgi:hypothetical protein